MWFLSPLIMDGPASKTSPQLDSSSTEPAVDALTRVEDITLQIEGDKREGRTSGYSILIQGEVQASSVLSSNDPEESITLFENNTKLLSGRVSGERVGFVIKGKILAAEFDEPAPKVELDGSIIEPGRWPTVKEYTGYGPGQESVEDPFPDSGELGASRGDPLNPEDYIIELDARELGETEAYCFDVDGQIIDHPDTMTISDKGDRGYGYIHPGCSAQIEVRGVITRIDTADGIDFSVKPHDTR